MRSNFSVALVNFISCAVNETSTYFSVFLQWASVMLANFASCAAKETTGVAQRVRHQLGDLLVELGAEANVDVVALAARVFFGLQRLLAHLCLHLVQSAGVVEEPFPIVRPLLAHNLDDILEPFDGVCHWTRRRGLTGLRLRRESRSRVRCAAPRGVSAVCIASARR